jgi:exosortase/archaeosortase family protein
MLLARKPATSATTHSAEFQTDIVIDVTEARNGLPFLFTNLALGVVLAWVLTLSLRHGLGLGGLGAVIAVAANLVWATGTALLAHYSDRQR